jgi:hypothetical protein
MGTADDALVIRGLNTALWLALGLRVHPAMASTQEPSSCVARELKLTAVALVQPGVAYRQKEDCRASGW